MINLIPPALLPSVTFFLHEPRFRPRVAADRVKPWSQQHVLSHSLVSTVVDRWMYVDQVQAEGTASEEWDQKIKQIDIVILPFIFLPTSIDRSRALLFDKTNVTNTIQTFGVLDW